MKKRTMWENSASTQFVCRQQNISSEFLISCNTPRIEIDRQKSDTSPEWLPLKKRRLSENSCNNGAIDLSASSNEKLYCSPATTTNVSIPLSEMNLDLPLDLSPPKKPKERDMDLNSKKNNEPFIIDSNQSAEWNNFGNLSSALLLILKQFDEKAEGLEEVSQLVFQPAAPNLMLETQGNLLVPTKILDPSFSIKNVNNSSQGLEMKNITETTEKQQFEVSKKIPEPQLKSPNNSKLQISTEENFIKEETEEELCDCVVCDPCMINRKILKSSEGKKSRQNDIRTTEANDQSLKICFDYLIKVFPDAEVGYMRNIAQKFHNHHRELFRFIKRNKKNPRYPKNFQNTVEFQETVNIYITNFDIDNFLKIYPNPSKYFENSHRKCEFSKIGLDFLGYEFNSHLVRLIKIIYHEKNYNLTLTALTLAKIGKDNFKRNSSRFEYPSDQLSLLQEISYILHRKRIKHYLKKKKGDEKIEFKMLKAQNALLKCQFCFKIDCILTKVSKCENGHVFCNQCLQKAAEICLNRGEIYVKCFIGCGSEFNLSTLEKVLDLRKFQLLLKKRQAAELLTSEINSMVPASFCHFPAFPSISQHDMQYGKPDCLEPACKMPKPIELFDLSKQ